MGFYTIGDRIKAWGGAGAFWGGIWGSLLAPADFVLLGLGVVGMAGPLVATLLGTMEGAAVRADCLRWRCIGADHCSQRSSHQVRGRSEVDNYLLVAHGSADDQETARSVLAQAKSIATV